MMFSSLSLTVTGVFKEFRVIVTIDGEKSVDCKKGMIKKFFVFVCECEVGYVICLF